MKNKFDLKDRLIDFAIITSNIAESLPTTKLGNHLSGQMIRSSSSTALNYGEVMGSESDKDFIHKMKIVLKELRETEIALLIAKRKPLVKEFEQINKVLKENEELISIIYSSLKTINQRIKNSETS